ncbi:MAG: ISLre2 family transposase, partial [Firmicutes bacterium]|nr:ISLre2 family transposase [Bacillota bacterium]
VRKNDRKEILTPFGLLSYERSYYRHKESKNYCYLVDEKAGITPHSRVSESLKAVLSEACSGISYEKATLQVSRYNPELKVSKQTVSNCVKAFKAKPLTEPKEKRRVQELYIEADEDHLKVRGKRGAQARLIYIHEGVAEYPRRHLVNARYFTTVQKKPEEFWMELCDYIEAHYDLDNLSAIYLSGDGARWIRAGQGYIPGSTFILDKFHLAKSITQATAHAPELKKAVYRGIKQGNKQTVLQHLAEALELAETSPRQERVCATISYIDNNWDGIESATKYPHVGCSAEGHVSHILSARLSSRPMAWSRQGAENMASMRSVQANRESIRDHYLARQPAAPAIVELKTTVQKELKRLRKKALGKENHNNVPLYQGGSNFTRQALKGLNSITAI